MAYQRIKHNRIQCLHCGDIVESLSGHHFAQCMCGASAADGGKNYLRRVLTPYYMILDGEHNFEDLDAHILGAGYDDLSEFEDATT